MKTPVRQKQPVTVKMPEPETRRTIINANLAITLFLGILAILIPIITHHFFDSIKPYVHIQDAKFKKFDHQIKALSQLSFIFSIYILATTTLIFIMTHFFNKDTGSVAVLTLRRVINNSLQQFIIFIGLYSYIVTQKGMGLSKNQLILIGNWFLLGRYLYLLGSILESITKLNFKQIGTVMNTITIFVLIGQVLGLNFLSYL